MNELVCGAGGKTIVVLPVHVKGRCFVVGKLLLHLRKGREKERTERVERKRRGGKVRGRERKREEGRRGRMREVKGRGSKRKEEEEGGGGGRQRRKNEEIRGGR